MMYAEVVKVLLRKMRWGTQKATVLK